MSNTQDHTINIGILLATHTEYGSALLQATENILGPLTDCITLSININSEVEQTINQLRSIIEKLDQGRGVLILTDMFGGTPTNLSLSLLSSSNIEVITGVNLPMMLRIFSQRNLNLAELAHEAKDAGIQGIVVAGEMLRG